MKIKYLQALGLTVLVLFLFGGAYSINTRAKKCVYQKVSFKPIALNAASSSIPPAQLIVPCQLIVADCQHVYDIHTQLIYGIEVVSSTMKSQPTNDLADRIRKNKIN